MTSKFERILRGLSASALGLSCAGALATGCVAPKQDETRSEGGISPDPTAVISGSVLYVGPRPSCTYENGVAKAVRGRVVLTMFEFTNPPPPEGRATSALNLSFVDGSRLFGLSDCLPEGAAADPAERITRTTEFSWPQIALTKADMEYQIRGFYDADEDMNPFFSVKNLPTAGDIAGAAVVDPQDASKGFQRIAIPALEKAGDGFLRTGVIVALGNYVWMERPAFAPSAQNRYLNAELPVAVVPNAMGTGADPARTVRSTWQSSCEDGSATDCGFRLEQLGGPEVERTFGAANVQLDFSPERYAFASEPVDIVTVRKGEPDLAQPDGVPDPHPLLGSNAGVPWFTPIVIMTRTAPTPAMQTIETRAGIPGVRLIGSTLLKDDVSGAIRRTHVGSVEIAVPPVAAVELTPDPVCRVPYIAPKNYTRAYETRLAYCSDLPTGVFGISAIQGVAGGRKLPVEAPEESDTGFVFSGGRLSGQAWSIPNDLANPAQVGADNTLPSQGTGQLFVVHDPQLDSSRDCDTAFDPVEGERPFRQRSVCGEGEELRVESAFDPLGIDGQGCLPQACCDAVAHLCGVPLCEPCTEETCPGLNLGDHQIRQGPTSIERTVNGKNIPNCVPFALPSYCCP